MTSVGSVGVGEIARAIVAGLLDDDTAAPSAVFLSPRGATMSAELADRYENVRVCEDNQAVTDNADLVIIALRRADLRALTGLRVGEETLVINVMAAGRHRGPAQDARHRCADRQGHPVAVHPRTSIGDGALPVADESAFDIFSALTGTLTSHYSYLVALTSWATGQGVDSTDADRYIRGPFQGVGRALDDGSRSLEQLAADHETPHGNNERIRTSCFTEANSSALGDALDGLLSDLRTPR